MMPVVTFRVLGEPSPQAGTKSVPIRGKGGAPVTTKDGRPMFRKITEGGVNLKSWRQEVAGEAARVAALSMMFVGPVRLEVLFRLPMPKSRPRWAILQRVLFRVGLPDLDKLLRAVGDSLKVGGLLKDDALIVDVRMRKIEVHESWLGCDVRLTELDQRAIAPFWKDET